MSRPDRLAGQDLAARLKQHGWRIELSKHYKAYCPCGQHMLVFSSTASDSHANKNNEARARRMLRECRPPTPS
jgi:hypothetical protein